MKRLIVTIAAAVLLMTVAAFGQPPCTNNPSTANMPCVWFPQPAPLPKSPLPPVPDPRDFDREMQRIAQQQERDAQKVYIPKPTPTPEPTPAPAYTPSETLFNTLPFPLTDGISRVLRGTSINRTPTGPLQILGHVRRDL